MLNRINHQFTVFGHNFSHQTRLNLGNTIFFFLVNYFFTKLRADHNHLPSDDPDSVAENVLLFLGFLSLISYFLINKNQIKNCFNYCTSPDVPHHQPVSLRVIKIGEEKYSTDVLKQCLKRSNTIKILLQECGSLQPDASPHTYKCPISLELMSCPVMATDGHTYDYESIIKVIQTSKRSPMTSMIISKVLTPCVRLQDDIEIFLKLKINEHIANAPKRRN